MFALFLAILLRVLDLLLQVTGRLFVSTIVIVDLAGPNIVGKNTQTCLGEFGEETS